MKDKRFIEDMLTKGEQAREKVKSNLTSLSLSQLNWHPEPGAWSIGQCLDHLVVSNVQYFPALEKIAEGNYTMSFWQKWSPFSGLLGKMLVDQISVVPKKKMNAPKVFIPSEDIDLGIYERFFKHQDSLLEYISRSVNLDIDKIKITSPVSNFVTYNLRNAYTILINHEHRHINQAIRVKENDQFPSH